MYCIYHANTDNTSIQPRKRSRELPSTVSDKAAQAKKRKTVQNKTPLATRSSCNQRRVATTNPSPIPDVYKESVHPQLSSQLYLNKMQSRSTEKSRRNNNINPSNMLNNHKKERLFKLLPNNLFYTAVKRDIDKKTSLSVQNRQKIEETIAQLLILPELGIPYTLLSSTLSKYKGLDSCNTLLNKVLVKHDGEGYVIKNKVQNIMIHNHITLSAITNMLHRCGNKTPASFDALVNNAM
ncbi:hypothetical protein [Cardinium endosymbiont of Nabis limbatus]|uniref:hypothetical protein n=1 Tax=Cardinium endosymbiont of Nabis limbatus TaxID=3066217 RepID=UPI003AF3F25A